MGLADFAWSGRTAVSTPPERLLMIEAVAQISREAPERPQNEVKSLNDKYFVVLTTCPDEPTAQALARRLVEERLAACVNRVVGLRSTYRWEGAIQDEPEVLLIAKTTGERLANLCARIEELHPYEVPEAIALPVAFGAERYLDWIGQTLAGPSRARSSCEDPT